MTGVGDKVSQSNDRSATTSHSATSADFAYDGIGIPSVTVLVVEGAGVRVTESDGSTWVNETAGTTNTDTYTVALDTEPTAPVSISIKVNGPGNPFYRVRAKARATLTFNPSTWSRPQTATVTGVEDGWDEMEYFTATFRHTATSTDSDYHDIQISSVDVRVEDVDGLQDGIGTLRSITIKQSDGNTSVIEGAIDTYTVKHDSWIYGDRMTIEVTSSERGAATVSPATLTFIYATRLRTVTVTSVDDNVDQRGNLRVAITHGTSYRDDFDRGLYVAYPFGPTLDMAITVVDDDSMPGVIIAESDGGTSMIEGAPIATGWCWIVGQRPV